MKTKLTMLICVLFLTAASVQSQTPSTPDSSAWKTYTVKDEWFSVSLPVLPAVHWGRRYLEGIEKPRRELLLGSYADGVVYVVYAIENGNPRQPLRDFIAERGNRSDLKDISRDGFSGKVARDDDGMTYYFAAQDRLYAFGTLGAPPDDARLTQFFSSISFAKTKGAVEAVDGPGLPYKPPIKPSETQDETAQRSYTGREVTRKVRIVMKPEPSYTEDARQNGIAGTVVLKCVFSSDGSVNNIRTVSGLPFGLTQKAIDAARKIKFLPAVKDGKFVSMWIQLEYNFNLY